MEQLRTIAYLAEEVGEDRRAEGAIFIKDFAMKILVFMVDLLTKTDVLADIPLWVRFEG